MKRILMVFLMGVFALMVTGCEVDDFKKLGEAITNMADIAESFENGNESDVTDPGAKSVTYRYDINVTDVNTTDKNIKGGSDNEVDL